MLALLFYSRIGYYVSSFQSIFTAEGVFHREAAKVLLTSLQGFKVHITWLLSSSFSSFSFVFQLSFIYHQICTVYLIYIIVRVKLCDSWVIKLFVISQSPTLSIFQTKTQMNDLMDGLIQDMSTGNYTTKRPYPASRFEVICCKPSLMMMTCYNNTFFNFLIFQAMILVNFNYQPVLSICNCIIKLKAFWGAPVSTLIINSLLRPRHLPS